MSFSLSKWVCPPPEINDEPQGPEGNVEWFRCLALHNHSSSCPRCVLLSSYLAMLVIALISYSLRMFSITAFYHRYFSHRTFKTSRFFQFVGAFIACSSGQRGPFGGQPITAGTTGIQTQTKMCIHHRQEAFFGVIPYGS